MTAPSLFIGVVSHPNSRFAEAQAEQGLGSALSRHLAGSKLGVFTRNLWSESGSQTPVGAGEDSLRSEIEFERTWAQYLGVPLSARWRLRLLARKLRARSRVMSGKTPDAVRLLNIEMSHRHLLRQGLDTGTNHILILEDDAQCDDVADLASGLHGLLASEPSPDLVNLSYSFSIGELGVDHLFSPESGMHWPGTRQRKILTSSKLVTNTVCALMYSRTFAQELLDVFEQWPLFPVLPIDWKVNKAITELNGSDRQCWWVDPPPITQGSMHIR